MLKALVIRDDQRKFSDLGDVVAVARAEGQKLFHTTEKVKVIKIFDCKDYYVAVVSFECGCSEAAGVSSGNKKIGIG
jgi:hypothetical protein